MDQAATSRTKAESGNGRRKRRHDPQRRDRLAVAATRILERDGVLALTHRAVATEAGVPLGSTTYHFADLDALLAAALEKMSDDELRVLDEWAAGWDLRSHLEDALVALVLSYTNDHRERSILEYEVHMLAYRRSSLKALGDRWSEAFAALLSTALSAEDIAMVIASFDAIMLHGLALDEPLSEHWARAYLRKVLPPESGLSTQPR